MSSINSKDYWENRFSTGDWVQRGGRSQTRNFAKAQVKILGIPRSFVGSILDFGCGLGDSIPVYKRYFHNAKIYGVDFSEQAISECKTSYGDYATFICGDYTSVPEVDIIISSNVMEHLQNHIEIIKHLKRRCKDLYIIVPYKESIISNAEHINSYDENSFLGIFIYKSRVFSSKGWSQGGFNLFYNIYFKNIVRFIFGKKLVVKNKQIAFHIHDIVG